MFDSSIAESFNPVPLRLNNTIWAGPFWVTVCGAVQVEITDIDAMGFSVVLAVTCNNFDTCTCLAK